jgi:thioredoxin 1
LSVRALTAAGFDSLLPARGPAVIDFWSEFCSPCAEVAANLEEIAADHAIFFGKVDVVAEPELAARFSVTSVPTLIFLRDGAVVRRLVGARPKSHIAREVAALG